MKKGISYNFKMITFIIVFLVLVGTAGYLLNKSLYITEEKVFSYNEKSKINYKVRLKNNDFYDKKVLDQDMSYIASLIDKIRINYNYGFKSSMKLDTKYKYDIIGTLEIKNSDNGDVFLTKDYNLLDGAEIVQKEKDVYQIKESVVIDYDYYNKIANEFKNSYKVNTNSVLKVSLKVDRDVKTDVSKDIESPNDLTVVIPLTQDSVSIKLDYDDNVTNDSVIVDKKLNIKEKLYLVIGGVLLLISVLMLILIRKLNIVPFKYGDKLKKILREYDRMLIGVSREPVYRDFDVNTVENFEELVDIYDLYKEPVRYMETKKNEECIFYIVHNEDMFIYVLKN